MSSSQTRTQVVVQGVVLVVSGVVSHPESSFDLHEVKVTEVSVRLRDGSTVTLDFFHPDIQQVLRNNLVAAARDRVLSQMLKELGLAPLEYHCAE